MAHEKHHSGVAHQFFMPPGPLAILPLMGNRSSLVWTEASEVAAELNALPDEDYLDVLRPRFGSFLGDLSLVGDRWTYPLNITLATSYVGDRLALLGDAAHGIHPIAGQGLNLGIKDVAALADVLGAARRRGEDLGRLDVLERYQRWRRFDSAAMGMFTDVVNRLFSNDDPLLRLGRGLGMGAISALPGLRRRFIREAAGISGELPELMRGVTWESGLRRRPPHASGTSPRSTGRLGIELPQHPYDLHSRALGRYNGFDSEGAQVFFLLFGEGEADDGRFGRRIAVPLEMFGRIFFHRRTDDEDVGFSLTHGDRAFPAFRGRHYHVSDLETRDGRGETPAEGVILGGDMNGLLGHISPIASSANHFIKFNA